MSRMSNESWWGCTTSMNPSGSRTSWRAIRSIVRRRWATVGPRNHFPFVGPLRTHSRLSISSVGSVFPGWSFGALCWRSDQVLLLPRVALALGLLRDELDHAVDPVVAQPLLREVGELEGGPRSLEGERVGDRDRDRLLGGRVDGELDAVAERPERPDPHLLGAAELLAEAPDDRQQRLVRARALALEEEGQRVPLELPFGEPTFPARADGPCDRVRRKPGDERVEGLRIPRDAAQQELGPQLVLHALRHQAPVY